MKLTPKRKSPDMPSTFQIDGSQILPASLITQALKDATVGESKLSSPVRALIYLGL